MSFPALYLDAACIFLATAGAVLVFGAGLVHDPIGLAVLGHLPAFRSLSTTTQCACEDAPQTDWFLGWTPYALLEGRSPWFSQHLVAPEGVTISGGERRTTFALASVASMPSDGVPYPLFSFVALVPWTFFANGLTQSSTSVVNSQHLVTKVYFPRLAIPIATVLGGAVAGPQELAPGGVDQVAQVVARVGVDDVTRQEGLRRVVGVVLVGGEKGRQPRFGERYSPWLAEMVDAAAGAPCVFLQDDAGPVQGTGEDPCGLLTRAFSRFDLHGAPLLPDHGHSERGDEGHDDERHQQRRTALPGPMREAGSAHCWGAMAKSRVSVPLKP